MNALLYALSAAASLGSLVCYILVIIHLFQSDQKEWGIACLALLLLCGIGGLVAFVKGWIDGLGKVMLVWTACVVVGILANAFAAMGN